MAAAATPDRILLRAWPTTGWPDAYSRYRFTLELVRRTKCRIEQSKNYNMTRVVNLGFEMIRLVYATACVSSAVLVRRSSIRQERCAHTTKNRMEVLCPRVSQALLGGLHHQYVRV